MSTRLETVPIEKIIVGKRFRSKHSGIEELAESIERDGLIQPITLNKNYELCAGGRRYIACARLLMKEVPCIIREDDESELNLREVELVENLYREDLLWTDQAKLVAHIDELKKKDDPSWTKTQTADLLGKSSASVTLDIDLAEALDKIPELASCKNASDARKVLKTIERRLTAEKNIKEHKKKIKKDQPDFIKSAASHFRIGNAFAGMKEAYELNPTPVTALIEVDPPYGINIQSMKKSDLAPDESNTNYNEISADLYPDWLNDLCEGIYGLAGENCWIVFWYGHQWYREARDSLEKAGFLVDPIPCIWIKGNQDGEGAGQTNQPDMYLARCYETFLIARKGKPRIQRPGRSNIFFYKPVPSTEKYHITQRPLALMIEILTTFAPHNSVVAIPFLGSGVTLRAAYKSYMTGFGWELNEKNKALFLNSIIEDQAKQQEEKEDV